MRGGLEGLGRLLRATLLRGASPHAIDRLRPIFERGLDLATAGRGIPRVVNGEHRLRISPYHRYVGETYEPEVFAFLRTHLRPGDTLFDVGAHIGIYAVIASRWLGPAGAVYAFEPAADSAALLDYHLRVNDTGAPVHVVRCAVGAASGEGTLYARGASEQNTLSPRADGLAGDFDAVPVDLVSLDDFSRDRGVVPDWVKVDTEGWELPVLRGAQGLIANRTTRFLVEMHPYAWAGAGYARADLEAFLDTHRLRVRGLGGQDDPLATWGDTVLEPRDRR